MVKLQWSDGAGFHQLTCGNDLNGAQTVALALQRSGDINLDFVRIFKDDSLVWTWSKE